MSTKNEKVVFDLLSKGKSVSAIVNYLVVTDMVDNKEDAKELILQVAEDNDISTKRASKAEALKTWFLGHEDPTTITGAEIKAQCESLEMKGGSVQYYVNSYKLAISLFKKVV